MDNILKKDLVNFFKKMNYNNISLLKDDKYLIKDLEGINGDDYLIQEGMKQCDFIIDHFSKDNEPNYDDDKKDKYDKYYQKMEEEREEREIEEKGERERKEKERRKKEKRERREREEKERKERERERQEKERERKERERKERERQERERKERKETEEREREEREEREREEKEREEKEEKEEMEKQKEVEEFDWEDKIEEDSKNNKSNNEDLKEENLNSEPNSEESKPIKKLPLKKVRKPKSPPFLFKITDEQNGKTERAIYDIGDKIIIKCEWKYLIDKALQKQEEEDEDEEPEPEKYEKVDLTFSTNYKNELILHWGMYRSFRKSEWIHPSKEYYPDYSKEFDKKAIQTEFLQDESEIEPNIRIILPRGKGFKNCLGGINFVIYEPIKKKWYNNNGKNYQIKFKFKTNKLDSGMILLEKDLPAPEFVLEVIECEANYNSWTLMHRYNKCSDIITEWDEKLLIENWTWVVIWLRYSYQRQLDWQRHYNTRPKELSNSMDRLSMLVTKKYAESISKEKPYRNLFNCYSFLIKYSLSLLGKGTGNGQAIRDEILVIMHKHKISENNAHFYEQWHQKLHNNTTPDDIVICEALLAFLRSGKIEDYRNTLKKGGVTKQRMASYERKITAEPWHNKNYIGDFERYLKILKSVHASTDLIQTYDQCKYIIGNNGKLDEIIKYKNDQNVMNQIRRVTEGRENLISIINSNMNDIKKLRDVLFFELSLEVYIRQLVERIIHIQLNYQQYVDEISLVIRNIKVSFFNYSEFSICLDDWFNVVEKFKNENNFSKEAMLKVKSVVSRLNRLLSNVIDYYNQNFDRKARYFGKECKVDDYASSMFAEELMRGSIFFALSMLLKKIEPTIRHCAQLGDWLVISRGKESHVKGNMIHVPNLHDVQFTKYPEKTVILTENVSGNEEIPINCSCLIIIKSENYPDILAHVSVRARNLNVPFVVCFNEEKANNIMKLLNKKVEVNLENQEVLIKETSFSDYNNKNDNVEEEIQKIQVLKTGDEYKKIYLELSEFEKDCVGAKSNNTKKVFGKVPGCNWLKYPESFAIPFNVHEYFMSLDENSSIAEEINENIEKIITTTKKEKISELLKKCKDLTMELKFVENSETIKLKDRIIKFGVKPNEFNLAFKAIKSVWASKFNERAYIATSKVGITLNDIRMAVLCQKIIPAEYAYVIHTKNPSTNNPNEVFAEICVGMGEALVGAYEGQSLSFSYNKNNKNYDIKSFPNKSIALRNSGFIFRSDSNTEDLEGFSGAGLFDSVPMIEDNENEITYHSEKIFYDGGFRDYLIKRIAELGVGVEKMYGIPQDIEGVFYNNNFYIVQTRPQV